MDITELKEQSFDIPTTQENLDKAHSTITSLKSHDFSDFTNINYIQSQNSQSTFFDEVKFEIYYCVCTIRTHTCTQNWSFKSINYLIFFSHVLSQLNSIMIYFSLNEFIY